MNKLFTKIAKAFIGLSMAIGVGVAVSSHKAVNSVYADSVSSASWTNKSVPSGWSVSDSTKYEFSTANNSYLKMWGGAYLQYDTLLRIDNQESFTISVQMQSFGSKSGTSFDLKGGLYNSSGTLVSSEKTFTAGSKTTNNFVLTPLSTAEYVYLRVYSSSSATSGTCTRVFSTSATYTAYSDTPTDSVTLSLSTNSLSIDLYTSTTAQLTATAITTGSATSGLSAVSSDTSVATISTASPVSGTAFTVTGKKVGSATITVTSTWDSNKSKTCTVTVTDSTPVPASETLGQDLDGKTVYIKAGNYYLGNDISSSATGSGVTTTANAKAFLFTLSSTNDTYEITDASDSTKYLNCTTSNGANVRLNTTACTWTLTGKTLASGTTGSWTLTHTTNQKILTCYESGPNWRIYNAGSTSNRNADLDFPVVSNDPEITAVSLTGSPAASASIGGGSTFKMTATVTTVNDDDESLSRNVNWTVSPVGAVTFSKNPSASGEEITVTAVNTANSNVKITASSAATGFTTVHADSNTFNIVKSYVVNSVGLTIETEGEQPFNADGASSFDVDFNTVVNYTGDSGLGKVNITVSPNAGVTGYGDNVDSGDFTLTFTKSGTYTITSTSVENNQKSDSETVTINNIVLPGYEKITSAANLRAGSELIIYSTYESSNVTYNRIMNTIDNGNNRGCVNYAVSDDFIPLADVSTNNMEVITLVSSGDGYWYLKTSADKYLWADETTNKHNYLQTKDTTSENTKFTISFNNNIPQIIPKVDSSRKIQFNHGNVCFACYTGTQQDVSLFLKIDTSPYFTINMSTAYVGVKGTQQITVTAHNGANASVSWGTSAPGKVSIPNDSTGTSVIATGVEKGSSTITATFTPLDGKTYQPISCVVTVVEVEEYVNIGVTTFTKVASSQADWTGTYLIVDEEENICFDGSVSPLSADSTKEVTITSSTISATTSILSSSFNIKASENSGYYNIRSNSGFNIGGADKGININIGEPYDLTIEGAGIITASDESTLQHVASGGNYFRFYKNSTGNDLNLYKANGIRREISETISNWYDNAKENEYLVCNTDSSKSKIDWSNLFSGSFYTALSETDKDTLKRMSAKSAEENGNYLEDFISDYDYIVLNIFKNISYDYLGRFGTDGANEGQLAPRVSLINITNTNTIAIIVIISMVSVGAIGGYFFLRKRKENI